MESSVAEKMLTFPTQWSPEAILVRDALVERGLETPMIQTGLSRDEKYRRISAAFTDITRTLGLDLTDDSLCETPHRIAKMYVDEIFSGLDYGKFPKITAIENKMQVEEMVQVDKIDLVSTCEHHFVTIDGYAKVAYIPGNRIIGLSKINRIVRFFAQRPQVQERLQAALSLQSDPKEIYLEEFYKRARLGLAIFQIMATNRLDALAYPTMRQVAAEVSEEQSGETCRLASNSGFPAVTVPAGFTAAGMPVGLEFLGRPWDDARLLGLAFAFEQATRHRHPPELSKQYLGSE